MRLCRELVQMKKRYEIEPRGTPTVRKMRRNSCGSVRTNGHENVQTDNRYVKTCLTPLVIRELQLKTVTRYHLTPVSVAVIKTTGNKCWQGCGQRGTLVCCCLECGLVQPLWETVWRVLED